MQPSNIRHQTSDIRPQTSQPSDVRPQALGRAQLALAYFPYIQPQSAWLKLKALLADDPDLAYLTKLKRRTFLPTEVNKIYQRLGQP